MYAQSHRHGPWPQQIPRSVHLTLPIARHAPQRQTPPPPAVVSRYRARFPPRDRAAAGLTTPPARAPPPRSREGPRASCLPRAARAEAPPAHVGPGPSPRHPLPDPDAAPPTYRPLLPRRGPVPDPAAACAHPGRLRGHVRHPGRPRAGVALRPRLAARGGRAATRLRSSHNRRRTHRDPGAPVPPVSGPRRPGGAPEHSRPVLPSGAPGAAAAATLRGRRRPPPRPSPGRGDNRTTAPSAGRRAPVEPNRPGRTPRPALVAYAERPPPIGPRAVARAGLGLSNSGRGARRGRPGPGRGGVTTGHSAEPPRTGPSRRQRGAGTKSVGREGTAAAGGGEPGPAAATWAEDRRVPQGLQDGHSAGKTVLFQKKKPDRSSYCNA